MRCPRCGRLWPLTCHDPIPWDCRLCWAASDQYTTDGIAREQVAPPAPEDVKGQALLPGTEGIAPPIARPPASRKRAASTTLGPGLFG